jgi:hypothetical protein
MKIEGWLFAAAAGFYAVIAVVYWFLSYEVIGTTVLALSAGLAFLIGFYVLFTGRRVGARPEDRLDAEQHEAEVDYGFFPPHSWWPLPVALSAAVVALGLIVVPWLLVLGVVALVLSVIGMVFEYYTGPDLS